MKRPVLYIFELDGELDEIITDLNKIKAYIKKYENYTKRSLKEMEGDSREV